jgi:hypothetical protein
MTRIEKLKIELIEITKEFRETGRPELRIELSEKYELKKKDLDSLLISECCNSKILQTVARGNGKGICENCRQAAEPKEPTSNCCDAEIWMHDSNYHGKCKACGENCTP